MSGLLERVAVDPAAGAVAAALQALPGRDTGAAAESERTGCYHCGELCRDHSFKQAEKIFCCQGCLIVHDLLTENGLGQFYELNARPGVKVSQAARQEKWSFLDEPALQQRMLDFSDGQTHRITFHIPAIHCVACVWLLENLYRLNEGVGRSVVNFSRRDLSVSYDATKLRLSELVTLLASIGYEPRLTLGELEKRKEDGARRRQWLQVGIAGFAFGNIMLMSVPSYLGLDSLSGPTFRTLFGYLSLVLALPVLVYSAADYWRSSLTAVRQRLVTLDVPIAAGLAALYAQSAFEIVSGHGEGYLDSMAGLVFFLLCGRVFQQRTNDRIVFDRDYKTFFPLSVTRRTKDGEENVSISNVAVGERLLLRNRELIPADATLISRTAAIDYSFVTGESEAVGRQAGDHLYAGGQNTGGAIEVETVKPVSQSYLTSLWSHEAFRKERHHHLNSLTNLYGRRFTKLVVAVALLSAIFWIASGDTSRGLKAFTSVLIVACPCALALAAPFTLGTAQRLLARSQIFLKNALVIERIARVNAIVFDKTGTLTAARAESVSYHPVSHGAPTNADLSDSLAARSLCALSTHPVSARIVESLSRDTMTLPVQQFEEVPGSGLSGIIDGQTVKIGSAIWLRGLGIEIPPLQMGTGSASYLVRGEGVVGVFCLESAVRPETETLLNDLGRRYELTLLSGDNERERGCFERLFAPGAELRFNQSPVDKLERIQGMQQAGKEVMMVGDGLNDAGALKQSDVGIAVVERAGSFSPGSDVIMPAARVPELSRLLTFSRRATRIVRLSFGISAVYNVIGISIAAAGVLSPLICAVLMPLSSLSVVLFASGATGLAARRTRLK